jgi:hypothetical protein
MTVIRPAMMYGAKCWATKRTLRWICGHTRKYRIRNDTIRDKLGVAQIQEKPVQHRLRWSGHIKRIPPEAPVRSDILSRPESTRKEIGRPRLTWEEIIKKGLND